MHTIYTIKRIDGMVYSIGQAVYINKEYKGILRKFMPTVDNFRIIIDKDNRMVNHLVTELD